jgi:hypothetical protein
LLAIRLSWEMHARSCGLADGELRLAMKHAEWRLRWRK